MENKAHYALVGTFVLITLVAIIGFVAWLANAQFDQKFDSYEVGFAGGVQGLSQGSEVRFNGLKVGEVTRLAIDPDDNNSVLVDIDVAAGTPVDTKSFGRLEPLGLTGLNYIQLVPGGAEFPLFDDLPGRGPYRLTGEMSRIDVLLGGSGSVIEGAQAALARVNAVMTPQAIDDFHGILENINQITYNLRDADLDGELLNSTLAAIEQAAQDVSIAALSVDVTAKEFDSLAKEDVTSAIARAKVSMEQLDKTLSSFDQTASAFEGTAGGADELVTDMRDAINRVSNSGLTDIEETLDGIRRVVITLGRITDSLEGNPAQFIAGQETETLELPQ